MPVNIKQVIRRRPVQQVLDDDTPLFSDDNADLKHVDWSKLKAKHAGHRTISHCRECGSKIALTADTPARLCDACIRDMPAALARLHATRIGLENEVAKQVQAWNTFLWAQPAATRARYEHTREATIKAIRGEISEQVLMESLQKAREKGDGLSAILERKEQADKEAARLSAAIDAVDERIAEYEGLPGAADWVMPAELEQARRNVGVFHQSDMELNAPRATRSYIYGRE